MSHCNVTITLKENNCADQPVFTFVVTQQPGSPDALQKGYGSALQVFDLAVGNVETFTIPTALLLNIQKENPVGSGVITQGSLKKTQFGCDYSFSADSGIIFNNETTKTELPPNQISITNEGHERQFYYNVLKEINGKPVVVYGKVLHAGGASDAIWVKQSLFINSQAGEVNKAFAWHTYSHYKEFEIVGGELHIDIYINEGGAVTYKKVSA